MSKIKQIIISSAIVVGVFAVLIWFSQSSENKTANLGLNAGEQKLYAEETIYNFGNVSMANGKVSHMFKIRNSGSNSVRVSRIYTSCMCTEAYMNYMGASMGPYGMPGHGVPRLNQVINPGEEADIEVIFDPAAHGPAGIGSVERAVYLENNAGLLLELIVKAEVTP